MNRSSHKSYRVVKPLVHVPCTSWKCVNYTPSFWTFLFYTKEANKRRDVVNRWVLRGTSFTFKNRKWGAIQTNYRNNYIIFKVCRFTFFFLGFFFRPYFWQIIKKTLQTCFFIILKYGCKKRSYNIISKRQNERSIKRKRVKFRQNRTYWKH